MSELFRANTNAVFNQNGRGNNWALGYSKDYKEAHTAGTFGDANDNACLHAEALELVRRQAERADHF